MIEHTETASPAITVLICTYNRRSDLLDAIASVVRQDGIDDCDYEILVVDNNSTDGTRDTVEKLIAATPRPRIRYLFEGKQGKTNALETGIAAAQGKFLLVLDSDQVLAPGYLSRVLGNFATWQDVAIVGGRVLPRWTTDVPRWLTTRHWSAIGMADYGDRPIVVDAARPLCLLAACFRLSALREVGGFRPGLAVSGRHIGGVEDVDVINRILQTGAKAYYDPELRVEHKAEPNRVTKRYHRRWHYGHGRFYALLADPAIEASRFRLFGVPGHMYRDAVTNAFGAITSVFRKPDEAFANEAGVWFFAGFLRERVLNPKSEQRL